MNSTQKNNEYEQWKLFVLLLKEIAESKGITQQDIAQATGFKQSNVSRFFSLRYKPTMDVFFRIAMVVQVNFFIEDRESKTELNVMFEKVMTKLQRREININQN